MAEQHTGFDPAITIGSKQLPNPVGVASGTFGYGSEYDSLFDLDALGGLYTKAVTLEPRPGNAIPRMIETPGGLINSIGLANVGSRRFVTEKYPFLSRLACPVIVNVAGSQPEDYLETLEYLEQHTDLWGYEVNVSCPNVKCGGQAIGTDPKQVESLTREFRRRTTRPVIIKLSPNVTDITEIARAAETGGADAVSCINTLVGMAIDIHRQRPVLPMATGGLSGPAIKPVGIAAVYRVSRAVQIPVIGIGGIMNADDAIEYLLAGASAVQTGTVNFIDPDVTVSIIDGIARYAARHNIANISGFHGLFS
ncbi:dihydroorotate dehydrogenase [Spirochaeta africana]|uniref:Dihydroorotate dehydrogenase n=1 Tax=Spirochaeta africana (strain ATCC 700263 / DSM 8902 / Z-7692) TaxID=889378 RepID=H9UIS4_SPIAZ|nr:dihydroorotate dehydrogenase [Spirochaeta africana]AFG37417.1 dihydroorotate dehydrogenase family protein [Spirochaeta africana DSM 8902]